MRCSFGSRSIRVDRALVTGNDVFVECILEMTGRILLAVKPPRVRLVLAEQQLTGLVAMQPKLAEFRVRNGNRAVIRCSKSGLAFTAFPRPGVAKPNLR